MRLSATASLDVARWSQGSPQPLARGGKQALIPTREAVDALERLGNALARGEAHIRVEGPPGVGKSLIVDRLLGELRSFRTRTCQLDGRLPCPLLLDQLLAALGKAGDAAADAHTGWALVQRQLRVARLQGNACVVAIEAAHELDDPRFLQRLVALAEPGRGLQVIEVSRSDPSRTELTGGWGGGPATIVVRALTRTDAASYIRALLDNASQAPVAFTDAALTAIHAVSHGIPGRINRLVATTLSLATDTSQPIDVDRVNDASTLLAY